ncbi:MAG: FtsW/RodA/SpoVE family cell cycle protein [Rickettsiales bacterium]|jgi:cell division protein FtsW|nr:FtsW/RodA/SpoVE family cell cycle protein [Rickettsiales bacterium]
MFYADRTFFISRWYRSVDLNLLCISVFLVLLSNIFVWIASPIVATRIGVNYDTFIVKNLIFSILSVFIMFFISFLDKATIKRCSVAVFCLLFFLLIMVLIFGTKNKGAKRWLYIFGFSLQPSEIIKPFFIIVTSRILLETRKKINIILSSSLFLIISILLAQQPDIGLLSLLFFTFATQIFLTNIDFKYFIIIASIFLVSLGLIYLTLPHFQERVSRYVNSLFFDGKKGYQVSKSLEAYKEGGYIGDVEDRGAKSYIPDSHTDFIFPIIAREFGIFVCILITLLYLYIGLGTIIRAKNIKDDFRYLSSVTLVVEILLQAFINIGVTLNILPTKGTTLPLISYGGSSMIGVSIAIGFLLALTKKDYGEINDEDIFII